jgi:uncharacterized surface protein with fasciclin (FAS1) repeats
MKNIRNQFVLLTLAVLSAIIWPGCKSDDGGDPKPVQTVYEMISSDTRYSTLKTLVDRAGLDATLKGSGVITFFAPTDDAWLTLKTDPSTLSDADLAKYLKNHLMLGKFTTGDFPQPGYVTSECPMGPSGEKLSLLTSRSTGSTRINAAQINKSTDATNGILHEMSDVVEPGHIYNQLLNNPDLTTFKSAVALEVDTKKELEAAGLFTLFAVNEAAMTKYLKDKNISISRLAPADRRALVNNGLIAGKALYSAEMTSGNVTTRGADLKITAGSSITLNDDVKVTFKDVQCINGVLHIIDNPLAK